MFKGLRALFTSGLIFNPMVLLGVISGIVSYVKFEAEKIVLLFSQPSFYGVVLLASLLYTCFFARVYKEGSVSVDWVSTTWNVAANSLKYLAAFVLAMFFIGMIDIF